MTPERMREIADEIEALATELGYDKWHAQRVTFNARNLRFEANHREESESN